VVVHAPGGNRELSREIGMRRLKKHAEDSGRTVAIATPSINLASRARQVRIPCARKPEHVRWDSAGRVVVRLGRSSVLIPPLGRYLQVLLIAAVALAVVGVVIGQCRRFPGARGRGHEQPDGNAGHPNDGIAAAGRRIRSRDGHNPEWQRRRYRPGFGDRVSDRRGNAELRIA
jgi:hypothetical protein